MKHRAAVLAAFAFAGLLLARAGGQETGSGEARQTDNIESVGSIDVATGTYALSKVTFSKDFYRIVRITDRETIHVFNSEFLLAEDDASITELRLVDYNQNGFGEGDIVVLSPSGRGLILPELTPPVRAIIAEWQEPPLTQTFISNEQYIDQTIETYGLAGTEEGRMEQCKLCVMKGALLSLAKVYYDRPIRMYLERSATGEIRADIWGHRPEAFTFTDCRAGTDTLPFYDVLQITHSDTLMVTERDFYDLIFVSRTYAETLFVEPPRLAEGRGTWEAEEP